MSLRGFEIQVTPFWLVVCKEWWWGIMPSLHPLQPRDAEQRGQAGRRRTAPGPSTHRSRGAGTPWLLCALCSCLPAGGMCDSVSAWAVSCAEQQTSPWSINYQSTRLARMPLSYSRRGKGAFQFMSFKAARYLNGALRVIRQ